MRKLLRANLYRLWRDKIFWICTAAMLGFSMFMVLQGGRADALEGWGRDLDYYYFNPPAYCGLILAVAIARFIGTDYDDGTIRNKCVIGHTRSELYLANLLTCLLYTTVLFAAWAVGGLAGIPYFGLWSMGLAGYFQMMVLELLAFLAMASFLVCIAQFITNRSASVITVFAAMAIFMLGCYFYNALCQPETYMDGYTIHSNGTVDFGDEVVNPAYLAGTVRVVYEAILYILPTGQQIWIANETMTQPVFMGICSVAFFTVFTVIGLLLFRKKDLK
jgi:ABC-type transport system involved in multi-copper enzyme maturation permease subunit